MICHSKSIKCFETESRINDCLNHYSQLASQLDMYLFNEIICYEDKKSKQYYTITYGFEYGSIGGYKIKELCNKSRIVAFLLSCPQGNSIKKEEIQKDPSKATPSHANILFVNLRKHEIILYEPMNYNYFGERAINTLQPNLAKRMVKAAMKLNGKWNVYSLHGTQREGSTTCLKHCFQLIEKIITQNENVFDFFEKQKDEEKLKIVKKY